MEIDHSLYLFCGRKCDRIKAILKEPDGIVMIYKRLTAQGSYRWPRDKSEVRNLTWREFDWLMSGIDIEQPKAIKIKCTLCQGHYDFSFSDFYFIFICCVEASK